MNKVFIFGMPYDIYNKQKQHKEIFRDFEIEYYITDYINKWSTNDPIDDYNINYKIQNINIDADCKIYTNEKLKTLYNEYFCELYKLLYKVFNDSHYDYTGRRYSRIQETLNDYVYLKEISKTNLNKYDKVIFMSLNMDFVNDSFDFISCNTNSIYHFINDTDEFFTNRVVNKIDYLNFDYEFLTLGWNFWWTSVSKFNLIVDNLHTDLLYIYNKMQINNTVPIIDTEIARGYILGKYIEHNGPIFIKKTKPDFKKLANGVFEQFEKIETIQ